MSDEKQAVSKDVEVLERFGRWLGETFEDVGERSGKVLRRVFRSRNDRLIDRYRAVVVRATALEAEIAKLTGEQFKAKTAAWRERLKGLSYDQQQDILTEIMPEAFACVREASVRTIKLRHFDVQLLGGIVLHEGRISEMATGEGKTLVATCPAYLNALSGRGVHIVTVNDYLARRDRGWMGPIYEYLGLTAGVIDSTLDANYRQREYGCDITYGTNSELGFDYLRDNMKQRAEHQAHRYERIDRPDRETILHYAIVDEVDSILVNEARTPLIISGMPEQSNRKYYAADGVARRLKRAIHFDVKEKEHTVILTEEGIEEAQKLVGVPTFYDGPHMDWPHHIECALRAHNLYTLDKEYVKRPGDDGSPEIVIVDEFTGRMMPGRRWSDGLHQAVEAKEGIRIREENQTLATITYQNYFKLYAKLAGMTGTAMTEAAEFSKIYNLDVVQVPTNKPNVRIDDNDVIYRSQEEKFPFVVQEIVEMHRKGRPLLVGTASIEKSEVVSRYLSDPAVMIGVIARRAKHAEDVLDKAKLPADLKETVKELLARPARMDGKKARELADRVMDESPKSELAFWIDGVAHAADGADAVRTGIPHHVLNAKQHEKEAMIIAQAGRLGGVTIATNMAGRGTDILLGGNPEYLAKEEAKSVHGAGSDLRRDLWEPFVPRFEQQCAEEKQRVIAAGGLHVLGTERHEARRIDNQLRGRCARQGDPGSSRFFLSLQDDLMRIFASDRVQRVLELVGMTEDVDIQSPMVSRSIRKAQKRVEARNFDIRKNLLEYDEVMDKQRRTVYELRQEVLRGSDIHDRVLEMIEDAVSRTVAVYIGEKPEQTHFEEAGKAVNDRFGTDVAGASFFGKEEGELSAACVEAVKAAYAGREKEFGADVQRRFERYFLLQVIDNKWKDHLLNIDALRSGIGWRGIGQMDPKNEFKKESFRHFSEMLSSISDDLLNVLFRLRLQQPPESAAAGAAVPPQTGAPIGAGAATRVVLEAPSPEGAPASPVPAGTMLPPGGPARPSPSRPPVVPQRPFAMPGPPAPQGVGTPMPVPLPAGVRRGAEPAPNGAGRSRPAPVQRAVPKVGRNDDCPCGSGKKYKKCHGVGAA